MRALVFISALASLAIACSDNSSAAPRDTSKGGSAGSPATSTGSGATGGTGASGGSGGSTTGTGASGGTGGSGGAGGSTGGSADSGAIDAGSSDAADAKPDIGFTWPETVPGLKCKPGRYKGTFAGTYASSATIIPLPIPVSGDIDLTLVQSAKGEVLEITDGKLSGLANAIFPFSADLVGKLDCKTSKLDPSTSLKNGFYIVLGINFAFEGPFLGDYEKIMSAFVNGTWDVKEPNPIYGGNGTWSASWISFVDAGSSDASLGDAPPADAPQGDVGEGGQ